MLKFKYFRHVEIGSEVKRNMFLDKYLNRKAFTALLVGSILAIMIGAVLLVISYVVINAIIGSTGTITNAALNTSLYANITNITAALKRMKNRILFDIRGLLNRSILHPEDYRGDIINCRRYQRHHIYVDRIRWCGRQAVTPFTNRTLT
jgi:hypothetical protein